MAKQYWKPGTMLYPIPAVMVSCKREGEKANIITVAWAGTINTSPAMVSISVRRERYSYHIIQETGEFVINLVTKELAQAADFCGVRSGRTMDKFQETGLTEQESQHVKAPGIAQSPLNIECRVRQVIPLGTHDMFIAEVLGVTVDDAYLDEQQKLHLNDAGLVAYSHGEYFELGNKIGKFGFSVEKAGNGRKQAIEEKKRAEKKLTVRKMAERGRARKSQGDRKQAEGKRINTEHIDTKHTNIKHTNTTRTNTKSINTKHIDTKHAEKPGKDKRS